MKLWALVFALVFLATPVRAVTFQPTVNPLLPVQNSPLASFPVRNNFQATYNDFISLAGLINPGSGTGTVTNVTCNANSPIICTVDNGSTTPQINISFPIHGQNTSSVQMALGATTSGDFAIFDANGNLVDGGGGGGGSVTWPTTHDVVISNSTNSPVGLQGTAGQVLQFNGASADPTAVSTLSSLVQGNITTLGTIATGVWQGTQIGSSFMVLGTNSAPGALQCDGSTTTCAGGIITSTGGGGGGTLALNVTTSSINYSGVMAAVTSGTISTVYTGAGYTYNPSTKIFNIGSSGKYEINNTQIACADLSNGATGCSTATGTSGATIPLLNAANTWSAVQSFNSSDLLLKGSSSGTTVLNSGAAAGTSVLTLPIATDTLVGKATTDTFTNKTYDTAGTGNSFSINGLAATANTGTGSVVRATSPTLTTPALGVPSAVDLSNATNLPTAALPANQILRAISFTIDGGGSTITTGIHGDLRIPFGCTITSWTLLADQSGSIVVNVWMDTLANYPPTVTDKITASAPPTISSATNATNSTLTGWTTAIPANDTLRYNVDSVTTIQRVTLLLTCNAT